MPTINGDIENILRVKADGWAQLWSTSTYTLPGGETIIPDADRVPIKNGSFTAEANPGEARIRLVVGSADVTFDVSIPDVEEVSLSTLLEKVVEYKPEVLSAVQKLVDEARRITSVLGSAEQIKTWTVEAEASAGRAEASAGRAEGAAIDAESAASESASAAGRASESAQAASDSASVASEYAGAAAAFAQEADESSSAASADAAAAKGDADRAAEQAQSANTAVSQAGEARDAASQSARQAGEHARAAAASAVAAGEHADRAESAADRAGQAAADASVSAVAAKVEELTRDAPEAFDTLAEIAAELEEGTSARAALTKQISEKADLEHTHTTADVAGLDAALAGKADASHTHTTAQITDSTYGKPLDVAIQQHVLSALQLTDLPTRIQQLEQEMPIIQVVDALPEEPRESTIYLVKE